MLFEKTKNSCLGYRLRAYGMCQGLHRFGREIATGYSAYGYDFASEPSDYLIDYQLPYGQVVAETDGDGNIVATYVYGLDRISMERGGNTFTYATDGQGSVRQLTNASGNVTDTYYYTAFGEELAKTGSTVNKFRYVGEQWDANAGFYYNRARWYSPEVGRFTSSDPYSGDPQSPVSLHRYLYGNVSPVNSKDPSGYFSAWDVQYAIGISAVLTGLAVPTYNKLFTKYVGTTNHFLLTFGPGIHGGGSPYLFGLYGGVVSARIETLEPKNMPNSSYEKEATDFFVTLVGIGFGFNIDLMSGSNEFETDGRRTTRSFAGIGEMIVWVQGSLGPVNVTSVSVAYLPDGTPIASGVSGSMGITTEKVGLTAFTAMAIWTPITK
jgi:RHS repeat-associated protein